MYGWYALNCFAWFLVTGNSKKEDADETKSKASSTSDPVQYWIAYLLVSEFVHNYAMIMDKFYCSVGASVLAFWAIICYLFWHEAHVFGFLFNSISTVCLFMLWYVGLWIMHRHELYVEDISMNIILS